MANNKKNILNNPDYEVLNLFYNDFIPEIQIEKNRKTDKKTLFVYIETITYFSIPNYIYSNLCTADNINKEIVKYKNPKEIRNYYNKTFNNLQIDTMKKKFKDAIKYLLKNNLKFRSEYLKIKN